MEKVVLGLSGGVDSAVTAALLQADGYEVHGLFLDLGHGGGQDAETAAARLGIPLYHAQVQADFERTICAYFKESYRAGRTPIPCVLCNPLIKFRALAEYADEIGAKYLATGHYARISHDSAGRALLRRAVSAKDQSYMLHRLPRELLSRCLFPLGEAENKQAVRAYAEQSAIPAAQKKDSMDLCFIPDGDWCGWLERNGVQLPEGNFVDESGNILGRHRGLHRYTVGQRKGLGISAAGRLFVTGLRPEPNEVVLSLTDPRCYELTAEQMHYCAPEYATNGPFPCSVRVRFSQRADPAVVYPAGDTARITFPGGVRAPAPGQAAVLYDGDIVIGGGFICPAHT